MQKNHAKSVGHPTEARGRQILRLLVYIMLVTSAATTFLMDESLWEAARRGSLPVWAALIPPAIFTLFVVAYTCDRWLLVRRHQAPLTRSLVQVIFAVLFLTLLLPRQAAEFRSTKEFNSQRDPVERLLNHPDANVRSAICELVGWRGQVGLTGQVSILAQHDKDENVRESCQKAIEQLNDLHNR